MQVDIHETIHHSKIFMKFLVLVTVLLTRAESLVLGLEVRVLSVETKLSSLSLWAASSFRRASRRAASRCCIWEKTQQFAFKSCDVQTSPFVLVCFESLARAGIDENQRAYEDYSVQIIITNFNWRNIYQVINKMSQNVLI